MKRAFEQDQFASYGDETAQRRLCYRRANSHWKAKTNARRRRFFAKRVEAAHETDARRRKAEASVLRRDSARKRREMRRATTAMATERQNRTACEGV